MVYYGLNKIKLAFDAQYETVILTFLFICSLTYLLTYRRVLVASMAINAVLALKMLFLKLFLRVT